MTVLYIMKNSNNNQMLSQNEELPTLIFLLQHNKIMELIKLMLKQDLAFKYLTQYGAYTTKKISPNETKLSLFSVQEIIKIKGSTSKSVRQYYNLPLQNMLHDKLKTIGHFSTEDRISVWKQLTQYFQQPQIYNGLSFLQISSEVKIAIQKDVDRTFLNNDLWKNVGQEQKQTLLKEMRLCLSQVLERFAIYNPYIGYCQGMNSIVMFFIEEEHARTLSDSALDIGKERNKICEVSFFLMKRVTEELLPCDYYSSMDNIITNCKIMFEILKITHPKVVQKMKNLLLEMGGDGPMMTMSFVFQWFVCLFTNHSTNGMSSIQRQMKLIIMDFFLLEGITVLFKAALAYFDFLEKIILASSSFQKFIRNVQAEISKFCYKKALVKRLSSTFISKQILQMLQQHFFNKQQKSDNRQIIKSCNRNLNTCNQASKDQFTKGFVHQFFVFRENEEVNIIPNYLQKIDRKFFISIKPKSASDKLRIGRIPHTCQAQQEDSTDNSKNVNLTSSNITFKTPSVNERTKSPTFQSKDSRTPTQEVEEFMGSELKDHMLEVMDRNLEGIRSSVLINSESIQFMRRMIQNQSYSNLINIMEETEIQHMFQDVIKEDSD